MTEISPARGIDRSDSFGDERKASIEMHEVTGIANKEVVNEGPVYDDAEHEPQLHLTTYIALASIVMFNLVITLAVNSPPAALTYIGAAFGSDNVAWVPAGVTLPQAIICPVLASMADVFQIRKTLLLIACAIAFVGSAIAPGSSSIGRLIAGQVLIGTGCSSLALGYAIPSEILPRKWRQYGQAGVNFGSVIGSIVGPLAIGALTRDNEVSGWRKFWWFEMALWGVSGLGILVGYRPPPRHSKLDHLSFREKLAKVDFTGALLLLSGLTLLLVGINIGGGSVGWKSTKVYVTLPLGGALLIAFGLFEWRGTSTGILHHDLFQGGANAGRTFAIAIGLIFLEGLMIFSFVLFYPLITSSIYEPDPFQSVVRQMPFWVACFLSTGVWAYISIRLRRIREPLAASFLVFAAGLAAMASIQPGSGTAFMVYAGIAGLGFSGPLILIITAVQLAVPHSLISTASAATVSSRSVSASVASSIYVAIFTSRLTKRLPVAVGGAAVQAGLPASSVPAFVGDIATGAIPALSSVPGVTPAIVAAGIQAFKVAFLNSARVVYIIAASVGALAVALCFVMGNQRDRMDYVVEAPLEDLHAKKTMPQA